MFFILDDVSFKIYCEKKSFVVKADNKEEKQEWMDKLSVTKESEKKRRVSFETAKSNNTIDNPNNGSWKGFSIFFFLIF